MKINSLSSILISLVFCPFIQGETSLFGGYTKKKDGLIDDVPSTPLSNEREIPLVGLGVGNLQANRVENMIYEGLKSDNRIRLIDTAHASRNERQVAKGITTGVKRFKKESEKLEDRVQVHVVTKIWYTHLGYERTKISVRESLEALDEAIKDPDVDLKVHFLIHWPKCHDGIDWMNCEQEERNLTDKVKKAGPPPHLDKDNAWKESWKALEDMYNSADYPMITSIGVSNFNADDMESLIAMARVKPHLIQINVWSLLHDMHLVGICNRYNVHIQVFNVMNSILGSAFSTPHAHHHLLMVANQIHQDAPENIPTVTAAQVVLKWLVQLGISIIPRTSNLDRLMENSAVSLSAIPNLSEERLKIVARSVEAMLGGDDLEEDVHVKVTFHAKNNDIFLYYIVNEDNLKQISYIGKGDSFEETTYPHHTFRLYNAYDPDVYHDYTVEGKYGDHNHVNVEL
jgi:diketogulonate reductase-like aldo/keto reductase